MLPYDYTRCKPEMPEAQCINCQRWADHPDQTWGTRTPIVIGVEPGGARCQQIPVDQDDNK